jgi:hypothetical protein
MKAILLSFAMALCILNTSKAQESSDSLGLPGDNFDLFGALELFKQSSSTEEYEKALNDKNKQINNLDLNSDGYVDYLKVVDRSTKNDKILILQAILGENESQDIAVLEMEKKGDDLASVQVIGDEALYGKDYIVEPKDETARNENFSAPTTVFVNVWSWPSISYLYGPRYMVWVSPYYWRAYPIWWQPWQPLGWHIYRPFIIRYHYPYYRRTNFCRAPHIHQVYYGHRTTSTTVIRNNRTANPSRGNEVQKVNLDRGRNNQNINQKENRSVQRKVNTQVEKRGRSEQVKTKSPNNRPRQNQNNPSKRPSSKGTTKQPRR